jgi:hypothetical protein
MLIKRPPDSAVDAVASDDQIGVSDLGKIFDLALELDVDTELDRSINQDVEKMLPANGVSVSTEVRSLRANVYLLVVP